jgi:hypothetical protein
MVLPLEASSGQIPQSLAKAASLRIRPGLSPIAESSVVSRNRRDMRVSSSLASPTVRPTAPGGVSNRLSCENRGPGSAEGRMTAIAACRTCGTEPLESARFCHGCGSPLNGADTRAEYKQVTVLFAESRGPYGPHHVSAATRAPISWD